MICTQARAFLAFLRDRPCLRCFTPDKVAVAAAPAAAAASSGATIILLSTLATATLAHYNAPAFRAELADPQGADLCMEIFNPTST